MIGDADMEVMDVIFDKITEEANDAKSYASLAMEFRAKYPDLANTLYDLSSEEMGHMKRLHDAATVIIEKSRNSNT